MTVGTSGIRRVMSVGNVTSDRILILDHLPVQDEVCTVLEDHQCIGGRGTVPGLVMAAAGMDVTLATSLGSQARPEIGGFLEGNGVSTAGIHWHPVAPPVTEYVAFYGMTDRDTFAAVKRPNLDWSDATCAIDLLPRMHAIYFSTNGLDFNEQILHEADAGSQLLVHNLGIQFRGNQRYLDKVVDKCHVLIANRVEMSGLLDITRGSVDDMFDDSSNLQAIVVTSGASAISLYRREAAQTYIPVEEVIPTGTSVGAGDTLAAGMLNRLLHGGGFEEAILHARDLTRLALSSKISYPDLDAVRSLTTA